MTYERQTTKTNIFGVDAQISKTFELPKMSWKSGKTTYSVTDIRPLNEVAVYVFEQILNEVLNEGVNEVTFNISEDYPQDKLDLIIDILLSISYEAKRRGGISQQGRFLIGSFKHEDGQITIELIEEDAKALFEYASKHPQKEYNLLDLVEAVSDYVFQEMEIRRYGK